MKKTKIIFIITVVAVFVVLNVIVIQKEHLLRKGRTVLLELAPRDPRSLMQGDYMELFYKIAREAAEVVKHEALTGELVIRPDENQVGHFVRVYKGGSLQPGECLLKYRQRGNIRLGAESFFFQEGHAHYYASARYGELRVAGSGESVLVGLRDEKFNPLGPAARGPSL